MDVLQIAAPANPKAVLFLLQLGGPKDKDAIVPFLKELFADVLPLPTFLARPLGGFIAKRRLAEVLPLYNDIGGGSPLLRNTLMQAEALDAALCGQKLSCAIVLAMRYAPPRAQDALMWARKNAAHVPWVGVPLYPHYSFATTRSSLREFKKLMSKDERKRFRTVWDYPVLPKYIDALADTIVAALGTLAQDQAEQAHIVFSAHGLPMALVRQGDPYPEQIQQTLDSTVKALQGRLGHSKNPYTLCFQSRVGPIKWLEPSTQDTLMKLGKHGTKTMVVVPIAFVSEHIETLHELDIQLKETAEQAGVTTYLRAPAVGVHPSFIDGLADTVAAKIQGGPPPYGSDLYQKRY